MFNLQLLDPERASGRVLALCYPLSAQDLVIWSAQYGRRQNWVGSRHILSSNEVTLSSLLGKILDAQRQITVENALQYV